MGEINQPFDARDEGRLPPIETLTAPDGSAVSFSPERGGIVTSVKLQDTELLYLDEDTFADRQKNVKGGIPILFPNAGPNRSAEYPGLLQHGFARTSAWTREESQDPRTFLESLESTEDTRAVFPHDFRLEVGGRLEEDGSLSLDQGITNRNAVEDLPVSSGLHPYFKVPHAEKANIKFDFPGGELIEHDVEKWSTGGTTSIDNPKVADPNAVLRVEIPGLGTLILDVDATYKKIWVWSQPDKDFVCIEPVMRDSGGLVNDPERIKPGQRLSARLNLRLEKKLA